jgi:hypothetical protein
MNSVQESKYLIMANGMPLHEHGAFNDLNASTKIVIMGANALKGIGSMMFPESDDANEEVKTRRMELSEIFSFFGEVLFEHGSTIGEATDRIDMASRGVIL